MTDAELWAAWWPWLGVAVVVVLAAATLLILIWLEARRILQHAGRALAAAEEIRANTDCIWELQTTNEAAAEIADAVASLGAKGGRLAEALEGAPAGGED